jgi:endoribonuclease Dicer
MVEADNREHLALLKEVFRAEETMRNFCKQLPEDRKLAESEPYNPDDEQDPWYIEEETGAKLTFSSAMQVITTYASNLELDGDEEGQPTYIIKPALEKRFVCQLILPSASPINGIESTPQTTKARAKRAAAFEACMRLRASNHLNAYFLPKLRRKALPKYANARLAVDAKRTNTYTFRRKPSFWDVKDPSPPAKLWVTIIRVDEPEQMFEGESVHTICIVTREMLPEMPPFAVYGSKGGRSHVQLTRLKEPLVITEEKLELLNSFLDRTFYDVFNKHFEISLETIRYWLAPVLDREFDENSSASELIDWETVKFVAAERTLPFNPQVDDPRTLSDKFFIDRVDRSRRFITYVYMAGLKPSDRVPPHISGHGNFKDIQDYSYNAGKKRRWQQVKWEIPKEEPVISAERLLHRLNYLDPPAERDLESVYDALIVPSNFDISRVSFPVFCWDWIFFC